MIISDNPNPELIEFQNLMSKTDEFLNADAVKREDYYAVRSGHPLEKDVFEAIKECAKGTSFQNSIQLVSGSSFPDIVAKKYYGVEVKSTKENHWTSIGSSILESTRNQDVKRIYLTFGKLGKPVEFLSRPYEECLSGIAVTHYPRYQIDMRLKNGETIFDKMGIPYDELRQMDNPVVPVSKYYRSKLKDGESLWWAANGEENVVSPVVRLWKTLTSEQKNDLIVQGYVLFPELLNMKNLKTKYDRFALWITTQGIVNSNVRDCFSAGGQVAMPTRSGNYIKMPAAFGRIAQNRDKIVSWLIHESEEVLQANWKVKRISDKRIRQWCELIAAEASYSLDYNEVYDVLSVIFSL